jgi:hypothetical protein
VADETPEQRADDAERARRRRERELLVMLLLLLEAAEKHARYAIRVGADPKTAALQVILGNASLEQPGGGGGVLAAMLEAHQAAISRVYKWAGVPKPEIPQTDAQNNAYTAAAGVVMNALANKVGTTITEAVAYSPGVSGPTGAMRNLRARLGETGLNKDNPSYLALTTEQAIVKAYNTGLYAAYAHPAIKNILRGFKHVSVIDNRTTDICFIRRDFVRVASDPYWLTNWPPLHFHCRSVPVPLFGVEFRGESGEYPQIPPDTGFGLAPTWVKSVV